jgi:hypothetical protein
MKFSTDHVLAQTVANQSTSMDRDAWYYMWGRFRISAAYQLMLTFVKFRNQIKPWLGQCFSILTSGDDIKSKISQYRYIQ